MKTKVPPFWEPLLKRYLKKTFYADTRKKDFADREEFTEGDLRFFAKGVRELNTFFTRERGYLPKNYFNRKELRSGYLLYFLPVNALKVAALLKSSLPPMGGEINILDIGSGPGTGMLGTFWWLEQLLEKGGVLGGTPLKIHWVLVDLNKNALQDAKSLHVEVLTHLNRRFPGKIESTLETVVADLFGAPLSRVVQPRQFDLILSLNFLSELPIHKRLPLLESAVRGSLGPEGRMLVMEPALQLTTRDLMLLHDQILARRSASVLAPCLHQAACPMLADNKRDWCHTYIEWERPDWIARLDHLVGIRKDYLKCSYMVLGPSRSDLSPSTPPLLNKERGTGGEVWRVVSGHLNSKGKSELLLCGPGGLPKLLRITRLDRDWSPANSGFDRVQRGELVAAPRQERILRETPVTNISGGVKNQMKIG